NTPLFLIRKLLSDPVVQELNQRFSETEILDALRSSASEKPIDLAGAVRPYVYLVALFRKPTVDALQQSRSVSAPYCDWFDYIREYLIETYSPVQRTEMVVPNQVQSSSASIVSRSPAERKPIIIGAF